jgi:hypothetical protein
MRALMVVVLVFGYGLMLPPLQPVNPPPALWRQWFAEVEACSGRHRDFDSLHFAIRDDEVRRGSNIVLGHFDPPDHIWVMRGEQNEGVLKHEMLHYLVGRGHPSPPFGYCGKMGENLK